MASILDDLFNWAAQQPANNETQVDIALTTVEVTRSNLVTYAEGSLKFYPHHFAGMIRLPAAFKSDHNQIKQYFSNRRSDQTGGPFDWQNTDPLTVSIYQSVLGGDYTIKIESTKLNWTGNFTPIFDAATNVLYGNFYGSLLSVALCGQRTQPPIK